MDNNNPEISALAYQPIHSHEVVGDTIVYKNADGTMILDPWNRYYTHNITFDCRWIDKLPPMPKELYGMCALSHYTGESLEGLPKIIFGPLYIDGYQGNDFKNLPDVCPHIQINDNLFKSPEEAKDFLKRKLLKETLLD